MDIVFTEYLRIMLLKVETDRSGVSHESNNATTTKTVCSCCISETLLKITAQFFKGEVYDENFDVFSSLRTYINRSLPNTISGDFNTFECCKPDNLCYPLVLPEQINNVYSKLLCMCLGDIIEDFLKSDYSKNCNIYLLDALQKIAMIYKNVTGNSSNVDKEQCILLYKLYFYVCLCIEGSKTINREQLVEYFSRIPDNESIFNDVFNDVFYAVEYQKVNGQDFKDYKHDNKYNYLVCVSQFLNILLTIKNKGFNLSDDFIPLLEQSKLEICQFSNQTKFNRGLFLADLCKKAGRVKITS